MTTSETRRTLPLMVSINGVIDDLHRSLGLADSDFFCECGHIGCKERITLTGAEYASLRDQGGLVLVPAHAETVAAVEPTAEGSPGRHTFDTRAAHRSSDPRGR